MFAYQSYSRTETRSVRLLAATLIRIMSSNGLTKRSERKRKERSGIGIGSADERTSGRDWLSRKSEGGIADGRELTLGQ